MANRKSTKLDHGALAQLERKQVANPPPMYSVWLLNDDYTPMEFVVAVLQDHFKHNIDSAVNIMLSIHHHGKGVAGIYPKDIAETKAQTVNRQARQAGYPLLTQIEPQPED